SRPVPSGDCQVIVLPLTPTPDRGDTSGHRQPAATPCLVLGVPLSGSKPTTGSCPSPSGNTTLWSVALQMRLYDRPAHLCRLLHDRPRQLLRRGRGHGTVELHDGYALLDLLKEVEECGFMCTHKLYDGLGQRRRRLPQDGRDVGLHTPACLPYRL